MCIPYQSQLSQKTTAITKMSVAMTVCIHVTETSKITLK